MMTAAVVLSCLPAAVMLILGNVWGLTAVAAAIVVEGMSVCCEAGEIGQQAERVYGGYGDRRCSCGYSHGSWLGRCFTAGIWDSCMRNGDRGAYAYTVHARQIDFEKGSITGESRARRNGL